MNKIILMYVSVLVAFSSMSQYSIGGGSSVSELTNIQENSTTTYEETSEAEIIGIESKEKESDEEIECQNTEGGITCESTEETNENKENNMESINMADSDTKKTEQAVDNNVIADALKPIFSDVSEISCVTKKGLINDADGIENAKNMLSELNIESVKAPEKDEFPLGGCWLRFKSKDGSEKYINIVYDKIVIDDQWYKIKNYDEAGTKVIDYFKGIFSEGIYD